MVPSINSRRLGWPSGLRGLRVRFPSLAIRSLAFESLARAALIRVPGALDQVAEGPREPPGAPPRASTRCELGTSLLGNLGSKGLRAPS